jgi:hypothetical protein
VAAGMLPTCDKFLVRQLFFKIKAEKIYIKKFSSTLIPCQPTTRFPPSFLRLGRAQHHSPKICHLLSFQGWAKPPKLPFYQPFRLSPFYFEPMTATSSAIGGPKHPKLRPFLPAHKQYSFVRAEPNTTA